ncbi:ion transporter [Streptococcus entericus]|uniref:ion transporter n=1 Tax=Streptococcus entericus TaxID=155680 RepID=UPI00037C3D99|nr:ion transporter [Streptococcus entericus]
MRQTIYSIISVEGRASIWAKCYDGMMIGVILLSLLPLMSKGTSPIMTGIEQIVAIIFAFDYLLRLATADFYLKKGSLSFWLYPLTFLALIDAISFLAALPLVNNSFRLLKVFRLIRSLRVFKIFRYSKNIQLIVTVLRKQSESLLLVAVFALAYIFISALVMFNLEPHQFHQFLDALYWATVTLTTIGYGDLVPQTDWGKLLTIFSSIIGIGVVALPAGIITAGYLEEITAREK